MNDRGFDMQLIDVYQVTAYSRDDGHRLNYGYYFNKENAELAKNDFAPERKPTAIIHQAVILNNGKIYVLPRDTIELSDDRQTILKKLTITERRVLGV